MHAMAVVLEDHLSDTEIPVELEAVIDHVREAAGIVLGDPSPVVLTIDPFDRLGVLRDMIVVQQINEASTSFRASA